MAEKRRIFISIALDQASNVFHARESVRSISASPEKAIRPASTIIILPLQPYPQAI
jgi:hypothetical protein